MSASNKSSEKAGWSTLSFPAMKLSSVSSPVLTSRNHLRQRISFYTPRYQNFGSGTVSSSISVLTYGPRL